MRERKESHDFRRFISTGENVSEHALGWGIEGRKKEERKESRKASLTEGKEEPLETPVDISRKVRQLKARGE